MNNYNIAAVFKPAVTKKYNNFAVLLCHECKNFNVAILGFCNGIRITTILSCLFIV